MKYILITGANSYIGTSFENYMRQWSDEYKVDTVDMIDGSWRDMDFSQYDTVFHVAGIAHIKETKKNSDLYYKVNRDLAIETAKKAKAYGVLQFIFLSSMSVYGITTGVITKETLPTPKSAYGKSKFEAEKGLVKLVNNNYKIVVLRPPMVYGPGCKGNYKILSKWAKKLPIFPDLKNQRSMIKIDKLCEFIKAKIDVPITGLCQPQDDAYVCTSEMVKQISDEAGHKIHMTNFFNPLIFLACKLKNDKANKIFGNLIYKDTV